MSREILLLVDALAREKNVTRDVVFDALEGALASAMKKRFKEDADIRVSVDRTTGDHDGFRRWLERRHPGDEMGDVQGSGALARGRCG